MPGVSHTAPREADRALAPDLATWRALQPIDHAAAMRRAMRAWVSPRPKVKRTPWRERTT